MNFHTMVIGEKTGTYISQIVKVLQRSMHSPVALILSLWTGQCIAQIWFTKGKVWTELLFSVQTAEKHYLAGSLCNVLHHTICSVTPSLIPPDLWTGDTIRCLECGCPLTDIKLGF